ncbi:enoyl-CoA hydratase/isomerase family protein [Microbacterium sp. LRZ72]|uniref:enoyl-CoA hydratase/isomerase family protein n=1 Tax=Microbacterium sp. LRZ72 TaxID=2942481 RepID=UPI0029ADB1AF|nr:enoyl-CoA hydratase/isomerase family protein [Microbacterium sp. LRZ72]MDX2376439.1 enoyl-CoA hydratase/isomerase family protein [Microbacterium sp. LRZ72]
MSDPILLNIHDGLARITLNRPERLNAFDEAMAHAWELVCVDASHSEDVGAILIEGTGPAFCAGGDVVAMSETVRSGREVAGLARHIHAGIRALLRSRVPVVAAAHGTTVGGGLGILLASDYAIVGVDSRLGSRYANVGLTPDLSVSAQLARAVGERRALQLLLGDRLLTAEEAREWGLVAEVVDPGEVASRAEAVARGWLEGATDAYGEAKRLVRSERERTLAQQLDEEARTIGAAFDTPDARARIAAFVRSSARKDAP